MIHRFLSTLSLRRATSLVLFERLVIWYFYPRSPCGERRGLCGPCGRQPHFYPRSPCGERREKPRQTRTDTSISIHALLAESDTPITFRHCTTYLFLSTLSLRRATCRSAMWPALQTHFYPRSPCGERPAAPSAAATGQIISIHALLAESDMTWGAKKYATTYFYPRSPCGERHWGHLRTPV